MRTTIDLPAELLSDAMRVAGVKTKTAAIIAGLKEILRRSRVEKLRSLKGRAPIDIDTAASRRR